MCVPSESMKGLVLLLCLTLGCLAQRPHPCQSPPLLTGSLSVSSSNEKLMAYAKYSYDAWGQRIRFKQIGSYENKTFHEDVLVLYKQEVFYKINQRNQTCCKKRLRGCFHPLAIPQNASLLGQSVLGSSSAPGQGLLVNTWVGEMMTKHRGRAKYMSTVTEFGCVPVSTLFHTKQDGWIVTSFFNNVLGIVDPQLFFPPPFCKDAELEEEDEEDPADFYSLFSE